MIRIEVAAPGLAVEAWVTAEGASVVPLGVIVEFHPGIPHEVRTMCLEQVLRRWSRETGRVVRADKPAPTERGLYLLGWTLSADEAGGDVIGMRLAFADNTEKKEKTA